ncbi:hypothetical protein LGR54_00640 [Ancylobacter sp. Lp-2]|uniref:hypothetical protein n=1 Tax=Ancylobacter sp. Lp-2 TaxID=2881339 RepID=UPI001E6148F8|nr:hypothetical protein [Ancylobacter sp. Lp-2]MCB4767100.1 hypothetical protein [Ancylobacter sp. Lp-2]
MPAFDHGGEMDALLRFWSRIGGLLPMAFSSHSAGLLGVAAAFKLTSPEYGKGLQREV